MLALEDLEGQDEAQVRDHIVCAFEIEEKELDGFEVLIAYESVGSWGCDSSNWFLLRKGGLLYENHGGHCSCNGFEGQWAPEETSCDYLQSDKFYFPTGGYDNDTSGNEEAVEREINLIMNRIYPLTSRRQAIMEQRARKENSGV